jgi:RNA polymerase-binding transcription factor DksA
MPRVNARTKDRLALAPVARFANLAKTRLFYRSLWLELQRQRAELVRSTIQELLQSVDATLLADLIDQASLDREQEFWLLVNRRTRDKLQQIDVALQRMEQHRYGQCLHCRQEIPLVRIESAAHGVALRGVPDAQRIQTRHKNSDLAF